MVLGVIGGREVAWDGRDREDGEDHRQPGADRPRGIDLLVGEGFYANRTDFIRSAIRRQLETRSTAVKETVARRTPELGSVQYTRAQLEQLRAAGKTAHLRVLGLGSIANDVSSELALATIESVEVLGAFRAAREVKAALSARTA